jgi:hypothetical protein
MTLALTSCPGKDQTPQEDTNRVIFVKGDPNELIQGASTNTLSPVTDANINDWDNMRITSMLQFVEREAVISTRKRDLERENETKAANKIEASAVAIQVRRLPGAKWQMSFFKNKVNMEYERLDNGRLQPVRITDPDGSKDITPVHWSVSSDGNFVSLLVRTESAKNGRALLAFYFEKSGAVRERSTTRTDYVYLGGPGVKLGWSREQIKELPVKLCGARTYSSVAEAAVERWNRPLADRIFIQYSETDTFAPFSDLNQHCIFVVNTYLEDPSEEVGKYGVTITIPSMSKQEILDSDILIYEAELNKVRKIAAKAGNRIAGERVRAQRLVTTFVHELGHLLGLGHKFDGTPSVMSYKFAHEQPQEYDLSALRELYPETN